MGRLRKNVDYENKLYNDNQYFIKNPTSLKGNWSNKAFNNNNDIQIEIGCGKGKFIIENAIKYPNINFIAIDKFATILFKVLSKAKKAENINNLKIVCYDASKLNEIFEKEEIDKLFLNFSDPWPKKHHAKNRLTNPLFLNVYFNFLKINGCIEFKTDNETLYNYTLDVIKENNLNMIYYSNNIYNDLDNNTNNIQTEYEIKWLDKGANIKKIIFSK